MNIKTTPLGQEFTQAELKQQCRVIYGGVSFPGRREGFAVVIAMDKEKHRDSHDIYLLDESESFDIRELVEKCDVLDQRYEPKIWMGEFYNDAAYPYICKLSAERHGKKVRRFNFYRTPLLDKDHLYSYILAEVKGLLDPEKRQLFLKESKVANYLSGIEPGEVVDLRLGDFPAVEALAFAVIEMRKRERDYPDYDPQADMRLAESYAMPDYDP